MNDREPADMDDAASPAPPQTLGYFRFVLQAASVALAYVAGSFLLGLVFVIAFGTDLSLEQTSLMAALSSPLSMLGGLLVVWLWLRKSGTMREALGLLPIASWPHTLGLALLATGGTLAIFAIGGSLVQSVGLEPPQVGDVLAWATASPGLFALWIVAVAWLGAGFGEEVLWRGFLMDRLSRLPGVGGSMTVALLVQAAIFGLAHFYQGWGGVLITGTVGLLMGWIRLRAGGAIWAAVLAHAAVDTTMLSLAYIGELGWYGS